jgi:ABC-type branched-subunit amino acid transport system substrate-binding protein
MLIERGGKYVLCSVFVDTFFEGSDRSGTKRFVTAFREAHRDATITLLDVVGYDTGAIVRTLVEKGQPSSRQAFREKLAALKGFEGATTSISFDDKREAKRDLFLLNITPKGIKEVQAAPPRPEG